MSFQKKPACGTGGPNCVNFRDRANAFIYPKKTVAVFELRAWARTELYAACVYDLPDAVDELQADAVSTGLVAGLGQDAVQRILANAFHGVRSADATGWKTAAAMAWNDPGWKAAAREYHDNRTAHQRVAA